MAFVSTLSVSAFRGQQSLRVHDDVTKLRAGTRSPATLAMRFGYGENAMLSKYAPMTSAGPATGGVGVPAVAPEDGAAASGFSLDKYNVWSQAVMAGSVLPPSSGQRKAFWKPAGVTYPSNMAEMRWFAAQLGTVAAPGGTPLTSPADAYMAAVVTSLYKRSACATGVYSVRCTEGTTRGQAELARTSSLAFDFRLTQRSTLRKFADYFDTRRAATAAAHGCSYEEALNTRYARTAAALVRGANEARGTCVRYASGEDAAEKYMVSCVDKQNKARAVPNGVYDVMCSDGTVDGLAENKRIVAMSAKFRFAQVSSLAAEQFKFDASKYARDNFSHMCSYEEALFNKYANVAAAMRAPNVRYS